MPVLGCGHEVPPRSEVTVDHAVRRKEPLCLPGRLEVLHLALPAPGRAMRVLGTIVEVSAGPVSYIGQDLAFRRAVAAQAIGDDALRLLLQAGQQAFEKALGRGRVPPALHQDIEHDPVLIHSAPEVVQHTIDPQEDLIEVPSVARLRPAPAQLSGEVGPEPQAPLPNALMGNRDPALGQDQLDVPQAEAEDIIKPYSMADDLGREAVAGVGDGLGHHQPSLVQPPRSGQRPPTWQCQRFKSLRQAQRFLSPHAMIYGHFRPRRHLMTAAQYRRARAKAFIVWRQETCVEMAA